jgi:hypothetical protein
MTRTRLRPLGTGEILEQAFGLYREQFGTLVATAALCGVPGLLAGFLLSLPVASLVGAVMGMIAFAALTWIAAETVIGRPVEVASAIRFGVRRVPRVVQCLAGAGSIILLVAGGGTALATGLLFLTSWVEPAPRVGLAVVASLVIGTFVSYLVVRYFAVYQIAILENERHFLKRSALLAHGAFWKIGVVWTVGSIVVLLPWLVVGAAAAFGGAFEGLDSIAAAGSLGLPAAFPLITWGMGALTSPFTAALGVLLYLDQRMRKDGVDGGPSAEDVEGGDPAPRKSFVPA